MYLKGLGANYAYCEAWNNGFVVELGETMTEFS
jgi:hypothetical protein